MSADKFAPVRSKILEQIDVQREYEKWGFKPSGEPTPSGWLNGFAIGREERNPSAGVFVGKGPKRGTYKDHAARDQDSNLSFFFAAAKFGGYGTAEAAVARYASELQIEIPKAKEEVFTPLPWTPVAGLMFRRRYPKVSDETLKRFGAVRCRWNSHKQNGSTQTVLTFPIFNTSGRVGTLVLPATGKFLLINHPGKPPEARTKHILKKSGKGWINQDAVERLSSPEKTVKVVWKVEGISDALTLDAAMPDELRDTHVVVTNHAGAQEHPDRGMCAMLRGLTVYILHDADEPGESGAKKWVETVSAAGATVKHVRLPYVVVENHGKDLRDFIEDGKTYEDLLKLADDAEAVAASESPQGDFPQITVNGRQMSEIVKDACGALVRINDPPRLFLRDGVPTQVFDGDETVLRTMSTTQIAEQLSRAARWVKETNNGEQDCFMPKDVAGFVSVTPVLKLPPILGLSPAPMFSKEGKIVVGRGYCDRTLHYSIFKGDDVNVSEDPTDEQIADSVSFIRDDLLYDFPFYDAGSVAAAFELMLRPFVRLMIDGPTPLTVIHAPAERTGKGLLAEVLAIPFLGEGPKVTPITDDDDELRKRITALLATGRQVFMLDNLPSRRIIDSPALAALLTSTTWEDRVLGATRVVSFPATATWVATGNNPKFTMELAARSVSCRLVADVEDPSQRTGFKHPHLFTWATENRMQLMESALTIISAWIAAGKPAGAQVLGRFESWAAVMGGILDVAGVPGLLSNRDDFNMQSNEQRNSTAAFIYAWKSEHGTRPATATDLMRTANTSETIPEVLGDGSARSQQIRLGRFLGQIVDRVFGGWRVISEARPHSAGRCYRLIEAESSRKGGSPTLSSDTETWES